MKMQLLTLSRKVAKSLSIASLVIASTFSLSFPSFAESLKDLSLETSDFAVRLYRQGDKKQLYINIWKREGKGFYVANASPVQKVEFTQEEEKFWLEIGKIILPSPPITLLSILIFVLVLYFLISCGQKQINKLRENLGITGFTVGKDEFGIQFYKASQKEIDFKEVDKNLSFLAALSLEKGDDSSLSMFMREFLERIDNQNKITVLEIGLCNNILFRKDALHNYLKTLIDYTSMEYVVFTESDKFKGYIDSQKLLYQIEKCNSASDIIETINNYKATKKFEEIERNIKGIKTISIPKFLSNKEALKTMKEYSISELAVVDKEMRLIGFTNQEIIATQILSHLILNN